MSAQLIEGRPVAAAVWEQVDQEAARLEQQLGRRAKLVVVQVGQEPSAAAYTRQILRAFERHGLEARLDQFAASAEPGEVLGHVDVLGGDDSVDAVLFQTPLPPALSLSELVQRLPAEKDAEGVHPTNAGLLWQGTPRVLPSTPAAGMELLRHNGYALQGKQAVVVGRSNILGKPLAQLLLAEHATVTLAHSRTRDLAAVTSQAEVLAVAIGRPRAVTADMVRPGAVVVDFGTTQVDGQLVGDVDFEAVKEVASAITPVPGGVGPVTISMLARSLLALAASG